jgi:hypothetical protein
MRAVPDGALLVQPQRRTFLGRTAFNAPSGLRSRFLRGDLIGRDRQDERFFFHASVQRFGHESTRGHPVVRRALVTPAAYG